MAEDSGAPRFDEEKVTKLLGWASLGLGAVQTLMPGRFNRAIGVSDDIMSRTVTVLAGGVREVAAAAGIFAPDRERPAGWLWGRVAGDGLDLLLLGRAKRNKPERPARSAAAMGAVLGIAAADLYAAGLQTKKRRRIEEDRGMRVSAAVTIRRTPQELYTVWRDFENLPAFMAHLRSVKVLADGRSRWNYKAPLGSLKWESELTEDRPNELIAWRSVKGLRNSGAVSFTPAPRDQGTEVQLEMEYHPPGGVLGARVAKLFGGEPRRQVKDDLRRFKQVTETGEVIRSDGTPEGQTARRLLKQRSAQPPDQATAESSANTIDRSYT